MNTKSLANAVLCGLMAINGEADARANSQLPPVDQVSIKESGRNPEKKVGRKEVLGAGQPRVVPLRAKPEIILKDDQIRIDGRLVVMGESIERWKAVIPGKHRCNGEDGDIACDWDELGITLLAEHGMVMHFTVYFNLTPWMEYARTGPDGVWVPPYPDTRPKKPFRGYFELDGYPINAYTRFWEIQANVNPARNVRCDLVTNNCGSTTARFGDDAKIFFELYESISENGKLADFTIGAIPDPATGPVVPPNP